MTAVRSTPTAIPGVARPRQPVAARLLVLVLALVSSVAVAPAAPAAAAPVVLAPSAPAAAAAASPVGPGPTAPAAAAPIRLSPGPGVGAYTAVAASGNTVYSVWQDGSYSFAGSQRILFKRSDDGGRTFGTPLPLSIFGGFHPSVAAFGDNVYVAWAQWSARDSGGGGNADIWVAASADRGHSFGPGERIDRDVKDSRDPQVVATSAGGFVAWADLAADVYLAHATAPGSAWALQRVATSTCSTCAIWPSPTVSIAADGSSLAIAWSTLQGAADAQHQAGAGNVMAVVSADAGTTVSIPIVVRSSGAPTEPPERWFSLPRVAVSGLDVHVTWDESLAADRRLGNSWPSAMVASSRGGGGVFGPPTTLGRVDSPEAAPSIVARSGLVAVAWNGGHGVSVSSSTDRGISFTGPILAAAGVAPGWGTILGIGRDVGAGPRAAFDWSVPPRFGPDTEAPIGLIDYRRTPSEVALPAGLTTTLDGCASTPDGSSFMGFSWRIDGTVAAGTDCTLVTSFVPKTVHQVELTVTQDGVQNTVTHDVMVDDLLIVSIGDSVASGEGNPDIPGGSAALDGNATWQDRQCDRSAKSGPALAARQLEESDPHTSVTFVHLACSGARVTGTDVATGGLLTPYEGIIPAAGVVLPPQVDQLVTLVGTRPVDALLVSIGANDVSFSSVVKDCIILLSDCTTGTTKDAFDVLLQDLPLHYIELAERLDPAAFSLPGPTIVPANRVFLSEYFDPTTTETGAWDLRCVSTNLNKIWGLGYAQVTDSEAQWASTYVGAKLNAAVVAATVRHGWHFVGGIGAQFKGHGYCAAVPWVVSIESSFSDQSDAFAFFDKNGAFHPNNAGHTAYGTALAGAVANVWQADAAAAQAAADPAARPPDTRGDVYVAYTDGRRLVATTLLLGPGGLHPSGSRRINADQPWWPPTTGDTSGKWVERYGYGQSIAVSDLGAWVGWWELALPDVPSINAYQAFVSEAASGAPNLAVVKVGMVQAPAAPSALVAGKSTAIQADIDSTYPTATWVSVHYRVSDVVGEVFSADTVVSVEPGLSTIYLHPSSTPLLPVKDATLTAEVTLDPTNQLAESRESDNAGASAALLVGASRTFKILYVPVAGASCPSVVSLAAAARSMTQAVLPIADDHLVQAIDCGMNHDGGGGGGAGVTDALGALDNLARRFGYDEVIGVVPALWLDTNWAPGTLGLAATPARGAPPAHGFLVEQGSVPMLIAHEIGHTFGQAHTAAVPAPGYWPATRAEQHGLDLMNRFVVSNPWLSRDVFQYLWLRLLATPGDPPVLVVRGVIHANGTVDAGPWIRQDGLLDAPLDAAGSLTLEYRDGANGTGALLGSTGFDASTADTTFVSAAAADAAVAQVSAAAAGDRMFNVRVPDLLAGTRSLVLREGAAVLLTRNVSAATPTVAFTAPLAGAAFIAGQSITATIEAADADAGDTLTHTFAISSDAGATWRPLAQDVTGASLTFTAADDAVGTDVRLRVVTTDGVNTATADSASFEISAGAPAPDPRVVYVPTFYGGMDQPYPVQVPGCETTPEGCPQGLFTMDPDGNNRRPVRLPSRLYDADGNFVYLVYSSPIWSPDGTMLAFVRKPGANPYGESVIAVAAPDGSEPMVLTPDLTPTDQIRALNTCPDWSPDGTRLLYVSVETDSTNYNYPTSRQSLRTIAADGTDMQTVITLEDANPVLDRFVGCPRWSPDGATIAFITRPKHTFGDSEPYPEYHNPSPYSIHPNGSGLTRLLLGTWLVGTGLDWSPDGSRILFSASVPGPGGLYVHEFLTMRPDGSEPAFLAPWPAQNPMNPCCKFTPDGSHLYFSAAPDPNTGSGWRGFQDLVVMDFNGTETARIHAPDSAWNYSEPDWVAPAAGPPPPPPPPPVVPDATAGGPYTAIEDAPIALSAGASGLAAGETPLAEWDLDADGVFDDATGLNPAVTFPDAGAVDVRVRITPSVGSAVISAVSAVTVLSAPPALVASPPQLLVVGDVTDVALAGIDDPGIGGHTATVTWGDGASGAATVAAASGGEGTVARGTHTYATPGDVTVTVRVCDTTPPAPADSCAEASFAVTVLAAPWPNTAPVGTDLSLATDIGVPVLVPLSGSDADGNPLTFGLAGPAAHGDALAQPDGTFRYLPDAGFAGIDTFTYVADDGWTTSAPATVTVQVGVVRPVAVDDALQITGSPTAAVPTEIPVTDLLANDHDLDDRLIDFAGAYADDGVHLAIERIDDPLLPTVLRLIPAAGFAGDTTFTYGISAGPGTFTTAQVRVRVISPVPGAPTGVAAAAEGSTVKFSWSAPPWTGNSAIAGYTATVSPGGRTCTTNGARYCAVTGLTDAPYTVTVTADNAAWTSVASSPPVPFRIDTVRPTATVPAISFSTGATIGSSTVPVHVSWSGADVGGSGIARFDVGLARNGSTTYAARALPSPTSTALDAAMAASPTTTWRFRVRSVDGAGNASAWVYGPIFRVLRTQESSTAVRFSGTWSTASGTSASGGRYRITSRLLASVSYTFTGRSVAWVAYRGTTLGRAKVYLDGIYRATVDLRASPTQWRRVVFAKSWSVTAKHTIRIVCLATPGRPRINIDAFVVLK